MNIRIQSVAGDLAVVKSERDRDLTIGEISYEVADFGQAGVVQGIVVRLSAHVFSSKQIVKEVETAWRKMAANLGPLKTTPFLVISR